MSVPKSSHEIRQLFLDYFKERGHEVVPSSSLVPANDPTLLFTNAGMNQFKDVFLGLEKRPYTRATSAQKCMRVSGKHNDLENVGPSPRHHTFFEMLGNFSFGDYFKEEAIEYAWDFLTNVLQLDKNRLWVTIYLDDDEAFEYWTRHVPPERILRFGKEENFWQMGDTGPCGPCSEIHYYWGPIEEMTPEGVNRDDRYLELWNLVFMQYDRALDGTLTPLPKPSIDTGMGLERITSVVQGKTNNYETDLFMPIITRIQTLLGHSDAERDAHIVGYRAIADHIRATTFLIGDGVLPGNSGRNYVLRLIMRRAMRYGKQIGFEKPFMADLAETVIQEYGGHYTELTEKRDFILEVVAQEEDRFRQTLDNGLARLEALLADLETQGARVIPGEEAFRLYDTYGFPYDLTRQIAEERGFTIDREGFDRAMAEQRARARAHETFNVDELVERYRTVDLPATQFVGYDYQRLTNVETTILYLVKDGEAVQSAAEGDEVELVLSETPFYAEGGGQVADTGVIETDYGRVLVHDVRRARPNLWVHLGTVVAGAINVGDPAYASIDVERRWDIMRNHTATHLLHRALRNVLGEHAEQRGSLVAPDYLRFDFVHLQPVTREELQRIEQEVLANIIADEVVDWQYLPLEEALNQGAVALFGEKYGETVRMVSIEDPHTRAWYSRELCGGTHVERTGQIGPFVITSESSISAGVRRIVALTGRKAAAFIRERLNAWDDLAAALNTPSEQLPQRVEKLQAQLREQEKTIADLRRKLAAAQVNELTARVVDVDGIPVLATEVDAPTIEYMRDLADRLREKLPSAVIVLGAIVNEKPMILTTISKDLVERENLHAGNLVKALGAYIGGGGGGRPTMAQAGGRFTEKLSEALANVPEEIRKHRG